MNSALSTDGDSTARFEGTVLAGRYRLLALLGIGGMGSVYRAEDVELDELVALKVLRRELVGMPGILDRFKREVKLARKVTHPNVARTFDIGEHGGERFLTMELVDGESLGERLHRDTRLPLETAIEIAAAVCHGLFAAHSAGVVHRDLKPDNILLGRDGRTVITDFGIARAVLERVGPIRTSGLAIGTPEYMAPEQVEARGDVDHRADLYALGVMLYEMLIGERPWTGDSPFGVAAARLINPPPDPRAKAEIPDALARVVLRCLARDPRERYNSATEVANALSGMTLPAGLVAVKMPSLRPPPVRTRGTTIAVPAFTDVGRESRAASGTSHLLLVGLSQLVATELARLPGVTIAPRAANVTVTGSYDGRALHIVVENSGDHFALARHTVHDALVDPFAVVSEIVEVVARRLALEPARPAAPPPRREVAELLLLARAEERRLSDAAANDRAIARWERAIGASPNDSWINAGYALALARRFVDQETSLDDAEEARAMAKRSLAGAPLMVDGLVALARLDRELGDAVSCAANVRTALLLDGSRAELHHLHGGLLGDIDDPRAFDVLARANDEGRWSARWDEAIVRALAGRTDEAEQLLVSVAPEEELSPGYWFARARLALILGQLHRALVVREAASRRFFERRDLLFTILDAAARGRVTDEDLEAVRAHRDASLAVPRRSAWYRVLEAELLAFVGDFHGAAVAIRGAVDAGLTDLAWLDHAPILEPLRTRTVFLDARARVEERAARIRRALTDPLETMPGVT